MPDHARAGAGSAKELQGGASLHLEQQQQQQGLHVVRAGAARRLLAVQQRVPQLHTAHQAPAAGLMGAVVSMPVLAVVMFMMTSGLWFLRSKSGSGGKQAASGAAAPAAAAAAAMRRDSGANSSGTVDVDIDLGGGGLSREGSKADDARSALAEFAAEAQEAAPPAARRRPLVAGSHGWVLSGSFTSPLVGHVGEQEIKFGKLLGVGSCSRVFRASWAGRDVAVKVLPHDRVALPAGSADQMQQLVGLDHPNLVRTHMAVTYTRQGATAAVSAAPLAAKGPAGGGVVDSAQQLALSDAYRCRRDSSSSSASRDQAVMVLAGTPPSTCSLTHTAAPPSPGAAAAGAQEDASDAETWFVQEYCDLGSLSSVALEWQIGGEGDVQMLERLSLLADAAQGLKALHAKQAIHGDLSAHNVLVSSNSATPIGMTAKLADAGLCAAIKRATQARGPQAVRGLSHMAPEVLKQQAYGPASDVYAFGIMMWEIYTGQPAYRKLLDASHLYEAIVVQNLRPKIPQGMPADYQLLMERCWFADAGDRPSVDKLIGCLRVMAALRQRRLCPEQELPPPATAAAAAAVAAAAARDGLRAAPLLPSSASCDQATLLRLVHQAHGAAPQLPWLQPQPPSAAGAGVVGSPAGAPRVLAGQQPAGGRLGPALPGAGLLHHKSCPATTFDALLRSGAVLGPSCSDSDASSMGKVEDGGLDDADALLDDAEEQLVLLSRTNSMLRSGPGSAPVMQPYSQPAQRYSDGLDSMMAPELDDTHTWVI